MLHHPCQPVTGTILVADDQASNRELLEELLTAQGFKVISVRDGIAALRELAETQVDLAGCGKTTARPKMLSRFQVLWG
jgi:CheY-like chemotaxis protein